LTEGKPTKEEILNALKNVYDPEIPVNIVDLGLVYEIDIRDDRTVYVKMTLTAPGCPIGVFITDQVKQAVMATIPWVKDVEVDLVFDPPWSPDKMSEEAKALLGFT